jgi:hypothetical protein
MHDQPEPTPEEQEQVPDDQSEHEAMRGAGHEDPPRSRRRSTTPERAAFSAAGVLAR